MKEKHSYLDKLKDGLIRGIGWSLGVTIGFVLISLVVAFALSKLGGLPVIGEWIASFVKITQDSLKDQAPTVLTK